LYPPDGREQSPGNLRKEGPDLESPVEMGDPNAFQHLPKNSGPAALWVVDRRAETDGVRREDPANDPEATSQPSVQRRSRNCGLTIAIGAAENVPPRWGSKSEDLCGKSVLKACPTVALPPDL
jgi:hypothetical protein